MSLKISYTLEEAAGQCACSVGTLKQAVNDGHLAARYAGPDVVIRHEDLVAWVSRLPTKPGPPNSLSKADTAPISPESSKATTASPPALESEWLAPEDLGKLLQLAPGTLSNWRSQRQGPEFKRFGGIVRNHRDAVAAWIKAQPSK